MTGITGFCLIERLLHFNIHGKLHAILRNIHVYHDKKVFIYRSTEIDG